MTQTRNHRVNLLLMIVHIHGDAAQVLSDLARRLYSQDGRLARLFDVARRLEERVGAAHADTQILTLHMLIRQFIVADDRRVEILLLIESICKCID
jgi:hypothetical protein